VESVVICEVKGDVICEVKGDQLVTQAINQAITIDLFTIWAILSKRDTTRTLTLPEFQWYRDNTEVAACGLQLIRRARR